MARQTNMKRWKESGNVLFLILIAVALFAALSYAVTQSTRSGSGDAAGEKNLISSAQLTQYPAGIRTALVRMIISNGTAEENLSFNRPSDFGDLTGGTGEESMGVFHPNGGGANYSLAPADIMSGSSQGQWRFNSDNEINLIGVTGGAGPTTASADIIAFLPDVSQSICSRVNEELGLPTTPPAETDAVYTPAVDMINDGTGPAGITAAGGTIGDIADPNNPLNGQPFGCFDDSGTFVYYHVLIER